MLVTNIKLYNLREQCKTKKLFDYSKFLDGLLSEYDIVVKKLLKIYGTYDDDLGMYFVSSKSDKYDEFLEKWSEFKNKKIEIDEEYYKKMKNESFFNE